LFLITSFRYQIGTDYESYRNLFAETNKFNSFSKLISEMPLYDIGAKFLVSTSKHFIETPLFHFSLFAFIGLLIIYKSIIKESSYYGLSILIFYNIFLLPYIFNGMMQGISAALLLLSTSVIAQRKLKSTIIVTTIALSFHLTGLLIIVAYFIYPLKLNKHYYLFILIISIVLWQSNITETLFYKAGSEFLPKQIFNRINLYIRNFDEPINLQRIAQRLIIFFLIFFHFDKLKNVGKFKGMFNIYFVGLIIYLIIGFTGLYASRVNMFFRFYEILLIPMIFNVIDHRRKLIYFGFIVLWGILVLSSNFTKITYYPFKTWLF